MKKQRKIVFWAASLLLTGALAAGGTLAYLTDKDSVTNQFVVGKVDIEGNEPSYAPDPDGKTNHIVPTQVIPKDPRIKNKGKNDSYVYMDVSIPIAKVIVADTSGNRLNGGAAVDTELFSMNQLSKKWVLMYKKKQNNSMVYTYLYNEVLAAGKATDPLFTSVTAANIVEGQLDEKEVDIPINYYAIQALNTGEGSTAAERAAKAWENRQKHLEFKQFSGGQKMKKKTNRLFFLAGAAGCTMAAAIWLLPGTSAYFTDHESVWNRMVFGHNTSTIDEEFPTPTPVPPGKSVVKRVKIRNEGSVACYIRAALIFSEPIEAIEGLDTENWVKGEDDYYYYKKPVSEGESTTELFTGIRVAKEMEQKELEVSVYEESVQIQKGNMVFHGYREAWDAYERGGQT